MPTDDAEARLHALLAKVSQQDENAFTELYRLVSRRVFAFALGRLRDEREAEEVVIDTMHEVWKGAARFRAESRFATWLLGIARHKILDRMRDASRNTDPLDETLIETIASDDADAFDRLAEEERREGVKVCLERLSDEHRECMHLVFYEGLSLAEIADIQHCPENTVKTRLFHARQKIKNCLKRLLKAEGETQLETQYRA